MNEEDCPECEDNTGVIWMNGTLHCVDCNLNFELESE